MDVDDLAEAIQRAGMSDGFGNAELVLPGAAGGGKFLGGISCALGPHFDRPRIQAGIKAKTKTIAMTIRPS